jgi:hypothetical protein
MKRPVDAAIILLIIETLLMTPDEFDTNVADLSSEYRKPRQSCMRRPTEPIH